MGGTPSCPVEFVVTPSGTSCVVPCPASKGYYLTSAGQVLSCTYTADPTVSVPLTATPMYMANVPGNPNNPTIEPGASYEVLPNKEVYRTEIERFNSAMAVSEARVSNDVRISTAFSALQAAENARGTPAGENAYEQARIAYYTLTQGDSWLGQEEVRIANTDAQPVVDGVVSQYTGLQTKRTQQQSTIEVINGLKDKVLSVKDDLAFSVNTFQKQVDAIKNQINIDKKDQADAAKVASSWIDVVLNWIIAITTIICIVMLARRYMRSTNPYQRDLNLLRTRESLLQRLFTPAAGPAPRPS